MLLEARGLNKRFGGLQAVADVDIAVDRGEILGLIGPNGSGKSTVLSMLMGLHRTDSGSIRLEGRDVANWPPNRIARSGMAMMFQHSRPLVQQTVLENLLLALLPDRLFNVRFGEGLMDRAHAMLQQVGLEAQAGRYPGELAFADLRRLELAKTLAPAPDVVLLDEPFAGLSAAEVREFSVLVRRLRDEGRAVILVDHNVKGVSALVDRIAAMSSGAKIADGPPATVLSDPEVRRVYLGSGGETHPPAEAMGRDRDVLTATDVSVRYGKATALSGVSLSVREASVTAVVGLNGAGKSTLFNAICGLVPSSGEIRFQGQPLARRADLAARTGVVLCPERRELFGHLSVFENLRMGGSHLSSADFDRQLASVENLFPRLAERRRQPARTLSGGEQQQLTIGRALMMRPRLLLIDEPTLGLAPVILDLISEAIERLRVSGEMSMLLAEQNMTFALRHAGIIHLLEHGEITWSGAADRFASEAGHRVL
jgi:branched-chain amino acid transport system ATP-binding protein